MKNIKFTSIIVPALLLASCGGKIISEDTAKVIIDNINEARQTAPLRSYDFSLDYRKEEKVSGNKNVTAATFRYKSNNDNGDTYYYQKGALADSQPKDDYYEFYKVKDDEYEEVVFINYQTDNKSETRVYTKKGQGEDYYSLPVAVQIALFTGVIVCQEAIGNFSNPNYIIGGFERNEVTYYSSNEKNLKCVINHNDEDSKMKTVVEYSNYDFSAFESESTSKDSSSSMKIKMVYDKVNIMLPNNWKKYLQA